MDENLDKIALLELWSGEAGELMQVVRQLTGDGLESLPGGELALVDIRDSDQFPRDMLGYTRWRQGVGELKRRLQGRHPQRQPGKRKAINRPGPGRGNRPDARARLDAVLAASRQLKAKEISHAEFLKRLDGARNQPPAAPPDDGRLQEAVKMGQAFKRGDVSAKDFVNTLHGGRTFK